MTIDDIANRLRAKARQSACVYRVAAVAFSKKNEVIGHAYNTFRFPRTGGGLHAEQRLIRRYGKTISTIFIARIGKGGKFLPIDPCPICRQIGNKLNIKFVSINNEMQTMPSGS